MTTRLHAVVAFVARALLAALAFACSSPSFSQTECRPFRSSISWSSSRVITGLTANEVCIGMVAADYPMLDSNRRIDGSALGAVPWDRYPGNFLCRVQRTAVRVGGPYDGHPLPEDSGVFDIDGIAPLSCPLTISLSGPGSTKALPAGPVLSQVARVTDNGSPAPGKSVKISVGSGGAVSGITDGAGEFHFLYVPPYQRALSDQLTGTCSGCGNSAHKQIEVQPCDVCE